MTASTDDCEQIGGNNFIFRLGSVTTIDKFLDLLIICLLYVFILFSTYGVDEFRGKIKKRWSKLSTSDQAWLIPHPSRSAWSDSREFNKLNLVGEIIGYKPRINKKNDAKCMDTYLLRAQESELVMTKLGQ